METKANYIAVGAFVLACMLALVVTELWLAGVQYSQEFVYYQTTFSGSVTGLGKGTVVRYNGIEVGRVDSLDFAKDEPSSVVAIMQVRPDLNIHDDAIASIASQGLTGGSYVEIDGGKKKDKDSVLPHTSRTPYPSIKSQQSTLAQLAETAPKIAEKLNKVADKLNRAQRRTRRRSATSGPISTPSRPWWRRAGDIDQTSATPRRRRAISPSPRAELGPTLAQANLTLHRMDRLTLDATRS